MPLNAAVSSPDSIPRTKKSRETEHEEQLPSQPTRNLKSVKVEADLNQQERKSLGNSFSIENDKYAQLSPTSNDVMAVAFKKDSRGRKKVTSNRKQKVTLGNPLKSVAKDLVYASPTMRIPSTRLIESKKSLTKVESAKAVTSIAHIESTQSHPGNENVDPQFSFGSSDKLKLENSTNTRRRNKKAQISPLATRTKLTKTIRSYENSPTVPASAVSEYHIATEDKLISAGKTQSKDSLPVARMRSGASIERHKRKETSKTMSLSPNKILTAASVAEHRPEDVVIAETSQQSIDTVNSSENHIDVAKSFENSSLGHFRRGQIEEDNKFKVNHLSTEAPDEFPNISASWRSQNILTLPLRKENEAFATGVSVPLSNIKLRNDSAAESVMEYAQNKIERDSCNIKGFRRPPDNGVLLPENKARDQQYKIQGDEIGTALNDSRWKSDEESSPKDRFRVDLAVDKSDDGEPSSDEDGVIAM